MRIPVPDQLIRDGFTVRHGEDDPELIDPGGNPIQTWRDDYPYEELMQRGGTNRRSTGSGRAAEVPVLGAGAGRQARHLVRGRDAAGKGGTIKRFMEHLNPRHARVVALTKPTGIELGQWYFHRYVAHLPTAGEIVLFDRSWYNRAGVERVMGFVNDPDYQQFLQHAPLFEELLVESGISLTKLWFSVTQQEQRTRFAIRQIDPGTALEAVPMDILSSTAGFYTDAKEQMLPQRTPTTPRGRRSRVTTRSGPGSTMRYFLSQFDYDDKDPSAVGTADPKLVKRGRDTVGD